IRGLSRMRRASARRRLRARLPLGTRLRRGGDRLGGSAMSDAGRPGEASGGGAVDERVVLAGVPLRNAVLTASGTFGYGTEFAPFLDLRSIGGFVAKSLTLEPRHGNPPPRIAEAPAGMLNAISIENVGVEKFLEEKLAALPDGVVVFASAFGTEP